MGWEGFEPSTLWFGTIYSDPLSYQSRFITYSRNIEREEIVYAPISPS